MMASHYPNSFEPAMTPQPAITGPHGPVTHRFLIQPNPSQQQLEILLRPANAQDIAQILQLTRTTVRFRVSDDTDAIDEDELRYWITDERSLVVVAANGPEIVAYACGFCVSPKWFFFDTFLVAPRVQNSGVGKELYTHLRRLCVQRGIELIQGLVKDGDPRALSYWAARGFNEGCRCIWVEDWLDGD